MSATAAAPAPLPPETSAPANLLESKIARKPGKVGSIIFGLALLIGGIYSATHLLTDLQKTPFPSALPYVLLGIALTIALGFEFVNGFHDTANAVATVIYTHTLDPHMAVVWSGAWNFIGVLTSSGAVAFGIVSLLPVELILRVGSGPGFAMIFALLVAAIVWNLVTWFFGIPNSSSHTLIGSIMGVGLMNQYLSPTASRTSGIDWGQATLIGKSLLISPILGFVCSALLLQGMRLFLKKRELYQEPKGTQPPPFWIRCLLFLTCTGVSFAHGSNDGQKGMGLIMLILIGTVPTAYTLNHAVQRSEIQTFVAVSQQARSALRPYGEEKLNARAESVNNSALEKAVANRKVDDAALGELRTLIISIENQVRPYSALANVPPRQSRNIRNDMYLASETIRVLNDTKDDKLSEPQTAALVNYRKQLDRATKFIPDWVKVAVALALGLGTMVGWKRVVVTVGERIGKTHLTYAQGAAAEMVAMATIKAADMFAVPVSTTHVLTSGVAGTMAASGSGLQWRTLRSLGAAWLLTLPVSIVLAAGLYWAFRNVFGA